VVVVRVSVEPPEMVSVSTALAVSGGVKASVTTKVKDPFDAAAGVPEIVPPADKLNPAGKVLPEPSVHV
jgi:hypothetical protein